MKTNIWEGHILCAIILNNGQLYRLKFPTEWTIWAKILSEMIHASCLLVFMYPCISCWHWAGSSCINSKDTVEIMECDFQENFYLIFSCIIHWGQVSCCIIPKLQQKFWQEATVASSHALARSGRASFRHSQDFKRW